MTGWRLKTCGVSSLLKLYDVKKAFPSPTFESIRGTLDTCSDKFFADMVYQHATSHRCDLTACDGVISLAPGSGFPQGSSEATDGFNGVYSGPLRQYVSETDEFNHLPIGIHPIGRSRVSCSSTVFVDDLATRLASRTPQHLLRLAERSSEVLDRSLDSIGIVQTADKAESVPSFLGSGSRSILKDAASQPGRFAREARYLGPYLHWGFSTSFERDRGIAAALRAWHIFHFWFKHVSIKFKMVVLRAVVLSTLISGLAAFPLSDTDHTVLDRFHDKLLKKMLGGKACRKDIAPDGKVLRYRALPSGQIRRLAGSVKIVTELRVARLKWFQGILADLDNHRQ